MRLSLQGKVEKVDVSAVGTKHPKMNIIMDVNRGIFRPDGEVSLSLDDEATKQLCKHLIKKEGLTAVWEIARNLKGKEIDIYIG
jgi:hypothetical protein